MTEKIKIKFILTSFRNEKKWEGLKYCISPTYPEDKEYGVAKPLEIPITIWEVKDIDQSLDDYGVFLKNNRVSAELALEMFMKNGQDVVLCCWCHPNKAKESVSCHREILGKFIGKFVGTRAEVIVEDLNYAKRKKEESIEKGENKQRRVPRRKKSA
jgi:hypothetical protein